MGGSTDLAERDGPAISIAVAVLEWAVVGHPLAVDRERVPETPAERFTSLSAQSAGRGKGGMGEGASTARSKLVGAGRGEVLGRWAGGGSLRGCEGLEGALDRGHVAGEKACELGRLDSLVLRHAVQG